jgi:glycosyltransferase involved in cell wall biosynthesis
MSGLIVQEWLAPAGGSENVVEALVEALPDADLWALWNDDQARFPQARQSWIASTPLRRSRIGALPFMLPTWRMIPSGKSYDWLLASSHLFAHHAVVPGQRDIPKFAYVHTPARYLWTPEIDERGRSLPVRAVAPWLRRLDRHRAGEITSVAANSRFVQDRISRAWGIDSRVIYPPVNVDLVSQVLDWRDHLAPAEQATLDALPLDFILGASRLIPYKRLDAVIEVGSAVGVPVVIAGSGPDEARLRALAESASVPVHFVMRPSDQALYALYQRALCYVFLAVEDFGIMPVEAMACGTPVIVGSVGGAPESVRACEGGVVLDSLSPVSILEAMKALDAIDRDSLTDRTKSFSGERFAAEIRAWLGL